jgi:hypothetical protein
VNALASSLHSNADVALAENAKLGDASLLGLLGFPVNVTVGFVPSTTTLGWEPVNVNAPFTWSRSSLVHVYVPSAAPDVARNVTVSVAPGHSAVVSPPGRLRWIFCSAIRSPSATQVDGSHDPVTPVALACTLRGATVKPDGMSTAARCAASGDAGLFVSPIVNDAELNGFTCDGTAAPLKVSSELAEAPVATSRHAAAVAIRVTWRRLNVDPSP